MRGFSRSCRHPLSVMSWRVTTTTTTFAFVFQKLSRSTSGRSVHKKLLLKRKVHDEGEWFGARFYADGVVGDDCGNWGAGRADSAGDGARQREGETGHLFQRYASMGDWEPALRE